MERSYLLRSWVSPKLVSGKSRIHGKGVLAKDAIRQGEKLMEFGGETIAREAAASGDYRVRSVWPVGVDRFVGLRESDPVPSLDEHLNHSCDANAWLDDEVTLSARRDIAAGEEITLDQGTWNFDDIYIEEEEPRCSCGARDCRGVLTNDDWRRTDVQERYRGHFHPLIQALQK